MTESIIQPLTREPLAADPPSRWKVNPYLHVEERSAYNPLTDRWLRSGEPRFDTFAAFARGGAIEPADADALVTDGWLVAHDADLSRSYRLKIVSLETNTVCNQACYFCPVSIDPRPDAAMTDAMFDRIVGELTAFRDTLEGVFLQSYNEPTVEKRFVEHCLRLFDAKLPVAVLSNGSALTPPKVDALASRGPLRYLAINLSTLDREKYKQDRGGDHLEAVLRNLEYAKDKRVADEMKIVVLGTGDARHQADHALITERFAGTNFTVEPFQVMDRAGYLDVGLRAIDPTKRLAGCDNIGSRPLQHLHITPLGKCILCCEDYDEEYVVGDLTKQSIVEVLEGDELAKMRRWAYGVEDAPENFMCRACVFARRA